MRISDWSSDVCSSDLGIRQKTLDHRLLVTLKALSFLYIVTLVSKVFPLEMVKICLIVQAVTQSFYPGHLYHGMGIQTNVIPCFYVVTKVILKSPQRVDRRLRIWVFFQITLIVSEDRKSTRLNSSH